MYDKAIFGWDEMFEMEGSFRFGPIYLPSHDMYWGSAPMAIVDTLVRRAKKQSEFFLVLNIEGPDWILAYLEHPEWGKPRFMMFTERDRDNDELDLSYVRDVSLYDFAERVIYDLTRPEIKEDLDRYMCFGYDDLMAKINKLKELMKDEHVFDPIWVDDLCGCKAREFKSVAMPMPDPDPEDIKYPGLKCTFKKEGAEDVCALGDVKCGKIPGGDGRCPLDSSTEGNQPKRSP